MYVCIYNHREEDTYYMFIYTVKLNEQPENGIKHMAKKQK